MTEAEWLAAPTSELLLYTLEVHRARYGAEQTGTLILSGPKSSLRVDLGRKHMLLAYGLLRQYWNDLASEVQAALVSLEVYEDLPSEKPASPFDDFGYISDLFLAPLYRDEWDNEANMAMWLVVGWWPEVKSNKEERPIPESWRPVVHDIFGNPFRPVTFDPTWRTSTVVSIAQGMYDSRDFSTMPLLADALQDAGCENEDILNHCRGAGPHVRGCWVVDMVLGKE
jgi:hypothetical protein